MSEFSELLANYISMSGTNVYKLAIDSNLDRTTLQKMVKGKRLPSFSFIKKMCFYLKLSKRQEEKLLKLFEIEKYGKDIVDIWNQIEDTFKKIGEYKRRAENEKFYKEEFSYDNVARLEHNSVSILQNKNDILKIIIYMIEQEVSEYEYSEMYMDVSWLSQCVLEQLAKYLLFDNDVIKCHHLVNLTPSNVIQKDVCENFTILRQVLPYTFLFNRNYEVRYAYVSDYNESEEYYLWPHYVVTHKHILLFSDEKSPIIFISDEKLVSAYFEKLNTFIDGYRPFEVRLNNNELNHMIQGAECSLIYQKFPEMILDKEVEENITDGNEVIYIFGMNGIIEYIEKIKRNKNNARTDEVIDYEIKAIEKLKHIHKHLLKGTYRFYIVKEEYADMCSEVGVKIFENNAIEMSVTDNSRDAFRVVIDEPGICRLFKSYFVHFLEAEYVYSIEESIVQFENVVEAYMTRKL